MKIGIKLTLSMIILSLLIIGTASITLIVQASGHITSLAHEKAVSTARDYGAEIQLFFSSPFWYSAQSLARLLEQYKSIDADMRRPVFNEMIRGTVENFPSIAGIWCIWEPDALEGNDQLFLGTDGTNEAGRFAPYWYRETPDSAVEMYALEDFEIPGEEEDCYYTLGKLGGRGAVLEPYLDDVAGKTVLMCSITAGIYNGRILAGVIGVDFTVDAIQDMSQGHKPFGDGLAAVYSNEGMIAGHFDSERLGEFMGDTEEDIAGPYLDDFLQAVKEGKELNFTHVFESGKNKMNVFVSPIRIEDTDTPWSFMIAVPRKTVMAPVLQMEITAIIICVIILALVVPLSVFLSHTLAKPIIKVTNALKDISEGEGDLTCSISVHSRNDEIGALSYYFNQTINKIKNLVVNIKKEANMLSGIGDELAGDMNETAAAVNEITSNIQSIKARIINQSASVTETNATMEQITVNINKLNSHVEKQTASVSASSSAIEQMLANILSVTQTLVKNSANVRGLMEASDVGRTGLQDVASDIQEIAHESEGLLEINLVMKNIASQTNLLSMNAAIEAAHAGEAGRGFAVVADEIRKLAENSGKQSKIISDVLKKIKSSIDKITVSTNNVLGKFEAIEKGVKTVSDQEDNIRNAMEEQNQGSKQVLEAISVVNEITRQVKGSSMEMLDGSREVINESNNLEKATQEITGGINEMATGADHINIAVNRVNDLSGKNRENINILIREVSRFKVE